MVKYIVTILISLVSCTAAKKPVKTITTLNGSKSYDRNGKIIAYEWKQLEGQKAMIYNAKKVITKAELPDTGRYSFELWGKNNIGLTNKDTTIIRVIE